STSSYLQENVLFPLGLKNLEFKKDARGNPLPASGFELTAREWAHLGELILGRGNYHGRQVVSAGLLQQAVVGKTASPSSGLSFRLTRPAPNAREIDIENEPHLPWERARWG